MLQANPRNEIFAREKIVWNLDEGLGFQKGSGDKRTRNCVLLRALTPCDYMEESLQLSWQDFGSGLPLPSS